jgi:putative exporter of polyketide antibiotics
LERLLERLLELSCHFSSEKTPDPMSSHSVQMKSASSAQERLYRVKKGYEYLCYTICLLNRLTYGGLISELRGLWGGNKVVRGILYIRTWGKGRIARSLLLSILFCGTVIYVMLVVRRKERGEKVERIDSGRVWKGGCLPGYVVVWFDFTEDLLTCK